MSTATLLWWPLIRSPHSIRTKSFWVSPTGWENCELVDFVAQRPLGGLEQRGPLGRTLFALPLTGQILHQMENFFVASKHGFSNRQAESRIIPSKQSANQDSPKQQSRVSGQREFPLKQADHQLPTLPRGTGFVASFCSEISPLSKNIPLEIELCGPVKVLQQLVHSPQEHNCSP